MCHLSMSLMTAVITMYINLYVMGAVIMVTRESLNNFSSMLWTALNPKKIIVGIFPIIKWSRTYNLDQAIGDLIAGITVALTLIPQSMAYAALAGFEPQYGLYGSFMGGFVYAFMGTCPQINIGPSALLSLLTFTYTNGTNVDFAILLCLMSGIIEVLTGAAQLGFLMEFISVPVVSGFTSAASLMVASSQLKGLLGLSFKAASFVDTWRKIFEHIGEARMPDSVLSLLSITILTVMQFLKSIPIKQPQNAKETRRANFKKKSLWFFSVARNAFVVILASTTAYFMYKGLKDPFILTGHVTPGLPTPRAPVFETQVNDKVYKAGDMLSHLGTGLLVVPMIGILVNVAIAKAFARGKRVDATQEILAVGVCNIVCSFFLSFPVNGSISRSAVSDASGVRTPAAGFYTGTLVILTLLLLTPYFYYIPKAVLSSVIVCAVLHMVEIGILKQLWRVNKLDLIPLIGCFLCCLGLGVEMGLLCGIGFDVLLLLFYNSRPPLEMKFVKDGTLPPHYAIYPVGRLSFAGAETVRSKLNSILIPKDDSSVLQTDTENRNTLDSGQSSVTILVVYCESLYRLDYTFLQSLKMVEMDWYQHGRIIFCNARPAVKEQLSNVLIDPIFCNSGELGTHLTNTANGQSGSGTKDTNAQ